MQACALYAATRGQLLHRLTRLTSTSPNLSPPQPNKKNGTRREVTNDHFPLFLPIRVSQAGPPLADCVTDGGFKQRNETVTKKIN